MSVIGSTVGLLGSAAGAPLSQSSGVSTERSQREAASGERKVETDDKAEQAGGIGQTEEDEQAGERDADGRRLWERTTRSGPDSPTEDGLQRPLAKDSKGDAGNRLDLVG